MATARFGVLFIILAVALAEDAKVKHKTPTKPVRLFAEEELQRYDGSEVNSAGEIKELACLCLGVHFFVNSHLFIIALSFPIIGGPAYLYGSKRGCV